MIRQNPFQHRPPPGWNNIVDAPRDGTVIEIQNNFGIAATYSICKWVQGRGWQDAADECSGVGDGPHLSWRPYAGGVEEYRDPTGGAQFSEEYWDAAIVQATGGLLNPALDRARNAKKRGDLARSDAARPSLMKRVAGLVFGEGTRD
jgi:hypothetical protein